MHRNAGLLPLRTLPLYEKILYTVKSFLSWCLTMNIALQIRFGLGKFELTNPQAEQNTAVLL